MSATSLPPIDAFYDPLNKISLSNGDYQKAQEAWSSMGCSTFREYMMNYLCMDVIEEFRKTVMEQDTWSPSIMSPSPASTGTVHSR